MLLSGEAHRYTVGVIPPQELPIASGQPRGARSYTDFLSMAARLGFVTTQTGHEAPVPSQHGLGLSQNRS